MKISGKSLAGTRFYSLSGGCAAYCSLSLARVRSRALALLPFSLSSALRSLSRSLARSLVTTPSLALVFSLCVRVGGDSVFFFTEANIRGERSAVERHERHKPVSGRDVHLSRVKQSKAE